MARFRASRHVRSLIMTLFLAAVGPLLSACSSTNGSVSEGRYTAPHGQFSLPIPRLPLDAQLEDGAEKDSKTGLRAGYVSFHDDLGDVRSIDYEEVPPAQTAAMSDPARAKRVLDGYVHVAYLPGLAARSPGMRVVRDEFVTLSGGSPAWFVVVVIPGGSTLTVSDAAQPQARRLDATRAFLFLQHQNLFMTLGTGHNLTAVFADNNAQMTEMAPDVEQLRSTLTELYASIRF